MSKTLKITYPDDLPASMGKDSDEFEDELRFLVAAKLYELGRISSGRASEIAGINRVEFLERLGDYRVSVINYSSEELKQEIQESSRRSEH